MPKSRVYNPERSRRGFTLVELLVTISIVAILSVIGIVIYSQVTVNARDARRKIDLQNIAQALEVYYQKNGRYPITTDWILSNNTIWITDSDPAKPLVPDFISSLPQDPKSNGGHPWDPGGFGYAYCSDSDACLSDVTCVAGQWYVLATQLENPNDPDSMGVKHYKWCDGTTDMSTEGWDGNSYVITPR